MCFVRMNRGGRVVLTTWGRSSGFCVDPVEKKPLNHFLPGTPVLSFGTAGCNLTCSYCQNWEISKSREIDTLADRAPPETIARAAQELGCRSVAYTYNDPVVFHEYAIDVARACRKRGIRSVAVTAGYVCPEPRVEFYRHMDACNLDVKSFRPEFYRKVSAAELEPVLDTARYVAAETDVWLEITTLVVPGLNDSETELDQLTGWVVSELGPDVPMHFSAFHPDYRMKDRPHTPPEALAGARRIALRNGVRYAYTGNVHDKDGQSTWCHHCGELLIGRNWYVLSEWNLDAGGRCGSCGTPSAGVFEAAPGTWGARRKPVRLGGFRSRESVLPGAEE
jgi:pyruvate formate lyase activating enzyme